MSQEKRKSPRRPVLDSFSMFIVIPRKGDYRLKIHDLNSLGLGFDYDIDGESLQDSPISVGESFDVQLYLNQTLYLPLSIKVARIETREAIRKVGAELTEKTGKNYKAFQSFIQMLDILAESAKLSQPK